MALFTHTSGDYLEREGARLYFEVTGNQAGFPLLLLHGGLGNLTDFNAILAPLIHDFKLISLDFRGHGKSSLGSNALTYQLYQEDVEALLSHLKIKQFAVMGFSDGGITAYRLASSKTSKKASNVTALVAIAAHKKISSSDFIFPILSGMTSKVWREKFPVSVSYYERRNPTPNFDELIKQVVRLWTGEKSSAYPGKTIKQIQIPTLLVRGEKDPLFSHETLLELKRDIKGAVACTIDNAGHEAYQDSPLNFMQEVKPFLMKELAHLEKEALC